MGVGVGVGAKVGVGVGGGVGVGVGVGLLLLHDLHVDGALQRLLVGGVEREKMVAMCAHSAGDVSSVCLCSRRTRGSSDASLYGEGTATCASSQCAREIGCELGHEPECGAAQPVEAAPGELQRHGVRRAGTRYAMSREIACPGAMT